MAVWVAASTSKARGCRSRSILVDLGEPNELNDSALLMLPRPLDRDRVSFPKVAVLLVQAFLPKADTTIGNRIRVLVHAHRIPKIAPSP